MRRGYGEIEIASRARTAGAEAAAHKGRPKVYMRCRKYRSELIEVARGAAASREVTAHVERCTACARFLDDQTALTAAMQSVAAEAGIPGATLEARVMADFPAPRVP